MITADRLQHEVYEPIRFVVPDLIPAEGVTLLCSKPKIGKSWLVLDLCIGCTTDRFILGQIKPVRVTFSISPWKTADDDCSAA